ncbi:Ribonucleotide reduction protein NrdI [Gulosibacter sp. 10]|nr:Ribonucleotide reduction protein NrdI [Gulosibacter sp. 10]
MHELAPDQSPDLVFFSNASENTRRFVQQFCRFELLGGQRDTDTVNTGLSRFWDQADNERKTA